MKAAAKLAVAAVIVFAVLQCIRPSIPRQPATAEIQAPPEVRHILETHCYFCHSSGRRLSWFDQIVPGYWLVRHDILTARQHLNFSALGAKPPTVQKATLYEAVNMVQLGAMPLPQFVALHPDARMSPEDLNVLKTYLAPWSNQTTPPAAAAPATNPAPPAQPIDLASVQPEPGGFAFDPSFENWTLLSTTDRGDNYSLRLILGNGIAHGSAGSGSLKPWDDGARFAKIAWQQQSGPDGLIHPGNFIQVELMDKNAAAYKSTDGWGWGRWRGLDLKPYGTDASYTNECTGCHQPLHGNDYVYTLPITMPKQNLREDVVNYHAAMLPEGMPVAWSLGWNVITLYVDPKAHTMSVLFGNPQAIGAVHARTASPTTPQYPAGAVLALVTWVQREDPHWFGARIPDSPQSVEFVQIAAPSQPATYRRFSATGLSDDHAASAAQRQQLILSLPPAALP
jgi:Haem-binding domain/Cytochrome P460